MTKFNKDLEHSTKNNLNKLYYKGKCNCIKLSKKKFFAPNIFSMDILAPRVANSANPGQFVIVIANETGERVPLTICDYDKEKGTVQIVVQSMGSSTKKLAILEKGDYVKDFVGPLGIPSEFVK